MFVFVLFLCLFSLSFCSVFFSGLYWLLFLIRKREKVVFEVSALKVEIDLCRAEMETERQTHQKEEKALRARVVEAEKQKDAAVESMKNECKGIAGFVCFLLYSDFPFC